MYAFVNNAGIGAPRHTLPQSGLQTVCATPTRATPGPTSSPNAVNMTFAKPAPGNGITLDILQYRPDPYIGPSTTEDKDVICYRVWKQVFGNAYVMESERAEAYVPESMFRACQISLKEFVRGVALSSTYKRRFFDCCGPYRAVELNFKHLFGRAPISKEEASYHVQLIANEGFEAEINSYIDSEEYEEWFGSDYVPYMRFKGTYSTCEEFNRMCLMNSAPGTTDKSLVLRASALGIDNPNHVLSLDGAGYPSKIVTPIASNSSTSFVGVAKAIPPRPDLENLQSTVRSSIVEPPVVNPTAAPKRRYEISMGNYMYLTEEEYAQYAADTLEEKKIDTLARSEILEAQSQIASLEAKIAELSSIL